MKTKSLLVLNKSMECTISRALSVKYSEALTLSSHAFDHYISSKNPAF